MQHASFKRALAWAHASHVAADLSRATPCAPTLEPLRNAPRRSRTSRFTQQAHDVNGYARDTVRHGELKEPLVRRTLQPLSALPQPTSHSASADCSSSFAPHAGMATLHASAAKHAP